MSKQESTTSDSRWWEFYFVRYAIGTVIGALLLFLLKDVFPDLSKALDFGASIPEKITVFAALGLTYCYIASTPLLVLHACRYNRTPIGTNTNFMVPFFLLLTITPIIAVGSYFITPNYAHWFLIVFELILLFCQCSLLFHLRSDDYRKLTAFYRHLDSRRSFLSIELRNSYKHLREHGNSIAIVVLEIDLAGVLYAHSKISNDSLWILVGTFGLWIAPAALIYVVGHELEHHLTN